MTYNYLNVDIDEITVVKINRPDALNALNSEVLDEIHNVFQELENNDAIRVIILTGEGDKAFVAGADIVEMKDLNPVRAKKFAQKGHTAFNQIEKLSKPVIAAINGYALGGGCELALSCDIRFASENAVLGQPEIGLGIIPGFGGTQRLVRIIGEAKAKELIFSGKRIDAQQAEEMGLVNSVFEQDNLMEEAKKLAKKISKQAPIAVNMAKESINFGLTEDIEKGLAYETNAFAFCFSTDDQKKGMEAFINKENVQFSGE
ncbi:MAG: enoyl-CoA hydratase-related protein [Halanaerobiales bacterium]